MFISPTVARLWIEATEGEIAALRNIAATCGDNYPDDFEPNDIPIYEWGLEWLQGAAEKGADCDWVAGKPAQFMTALLAVYARNNISNISPSEYQEIFKTYCELCLEYALAQIAWHSKCGDQTSLPSTYKYLARSALKHIEQFPEKSS